MSIKWKMMILVILIIVATSVSLGFASIQESDDIIRDQVRDHLVTTAQSRADHIETFISSQKAAAELMAAAISPFRSEMKESGEVPTEIIEFAMGIDVDEITTGGHLLVIDKEGKLTFGMGRYGFQIGLGEAEGLDFSNWEVFQQAQESIQVTDTHINLLTPETVMVVATAYYVDSEFDGIVAIIGGEDFLEKIVGDRTGLGESGEVYIVNGQGDMLTPARSNGNEPLYYSVDLSEMTQRADHKYSSNVGLITSFTNYNGKEVVNAHTGVNNTNWTVVAEMEKSEAFSPVSDLASIISWIVLVLCAAGLLVSFVISRLTVRPLLRLKAGAESILAGNLNHRTDIRSNDEIGMVSKAFDRMAIGLRESRDQLKSYTHNLEQKVNERTAEIEQTNISLQNEIMERKHIEKELKEKTGMLIEAEKFRSAGIMVGGVAHELNNPMTGIIQYAQFCLRRTSEDDRRYSVLKDIETEARRCTDIIRNMLTFSRVESEGLEATQQENIPALINRVLQLLAYRIRAEQITVNQQHPDDLPPIPMKVNSIQQVFLHIIGNAIDVLHENPEKLISIESHLITDNIEIVVSDNGPGIPSENLQKIFDPFYTTKVVGEGTGLGLSVSKRICQQHGGDIECESEVGIGTKFKVILPIKRDINKYKEEV